MERKSIPDYAEIIGHQVKIIRSKIGLTQSELADSCGIFRTYLSRIELGKANPTIAVLANLAENLHVDLCDLLSEDLPD